VIRRLTDALLAAFLAPPCAVCARVLDCPLDGAVCERCWSAIADHPARLRPTACISKGAALGEYDGVLREIIHALKYCGRRSTARRLASLMRSHAGDVLDGVDAVVPVPLHRRRQRERGFNQADDLANGLGLPVAQLLRRRRGTAPQVGLSATARRDNVRDAFELIGRSEDRRLRAIRTGRGLSSDRPNPALEGKTFVLVDDVTTTGATLEACAQVLRRAGAKEVRALTAARVSS
jgi:predicted amidophosphoribosyltransferase